MNNIQILKKLYNEYTKSFLPKILISVFFSVLVAGSTSAIAWLLDPAIKKIFIEKDQTLILLIPAAIVFAFTTKGVSLYIAKTTLIKVGQEVSKILQLQLMKSIIKADAEIVEKKHSGKFISHLNFDISLMTNLISVVILNIAKDSLTFLPGNPAANKSSISLGSVKNSGSSNPFGAPIGHLSGAKLWIYKKSFVLIARDG